MRARPPELSVNKRPSSGLAHTLAMVLTMTLAFSVPVSAQESTEPDAEGQPEPVARLATAKPASSIQLKTTSVTGSRELPKVLVIVPWKSSETMGPGERPLSSLVEEALTPVDPDVFRRQLSYYTKLKEASAKAGSGGTSN